MAWLSGWSYRKEISITGQSGAGTNYQVDLDIGDSAGGDFHLEGHCTNFPQDIAVTDNDETTLIDYWIEDVTADPLKMWVEVADDLGSNQTIYIYYGKSGATTDSNIGNTFIFGDDFSSDLSKWSQLEGTSNISGGYLELQDDEDLNSISTYNVENKVLEVYTHVDVVADNRPVIGFTDQNVGDWDWWLSGDAEMIQLHPTAGLYTYTENNGVVTQNNPTDTTPTTDKIYKIIDATDSYFYYDGVLKATHSTNEPDANMYIRLSQTAAYSGTTYINWIILREYIANEPAFSSAGSEETPPTGVSPTAVFYGPLVGPLGGPI